MPRTPLTAVPATRSSLPMLRIRRRVLLGALCVAAAMGPLSLVIAAHNSSAPVAAPVVLPDQQAISLAQTVAQDYFAARKSTVPAANGVDVDFSHIGQTLTPATPSNLQSLAYAGTQTAVLGDGHDAGTPPEKTVQESFTAQVDSKLYTVTVPMVEAGGHWILAADPAVLPANVGHGGQDALDYKSLYAAGGDDSILPNNNYVTRIDNWAVTFAQAGHADANLYAITGDQGARTYSGLGGWSVVGTPQIGSVVKVKPSSFGPAGYIVRVSLVLRSPATNGPTLSADYDVYIESDKSQTLPPVIAWAPAGSYQTLEPHMNADQQ